MVQAAAAGDESAFRALVDRNYDACLRYAARMLGDRADAEDAVQDTFVRAYRSLANYRERGYFRAWLFRILVNRCRSLARSRDRRCSVIVAADAIPAEARGVEPREGAPFRQRALEQALAELPPALREAFLLKAVEEWTYDEIVDFTGASVPALKMRVSRAKEFLRERLQEVRDD